MKNIFSLLVLLSILTAVESFAQNNNNGKLDMLSEFSTISTVYFVMPDGVKLATDIYLPIISDSVTTLFNNHIIEIIPKGTQLFVYDSLNGEINPNKYQLPIVLTRTPYNKGDLDQFGVYLNILGYAYSLQDMRGRYSSEGVYLPMYSDGWSKNEYHPNETNPLDVTDASDPLNGNFHEDGKYSIKFIMDSLNRDFDLDGDGIFETNDKLYNGSIAMFGASALGNTQYQAASSIKNNVSVDGLKGLVPIVATNEHFNSVNQHNGVFRQALVQGWQTGQMLDNVDTIPSDDDVQNNIHSIFDYGNISGEQVISNAIDFVSTVPDINGYTAMYPNYATRGDVNASFAPVNELGESDPNGQYSRYTNLELPMYHMTGWWDIFIDGQLDTYNNIMSNTSESTQTNQKIVIGPWTHGTISKAEVGDIVYPESVFDLKFSGAIDAESVSISDMMEGEVIDWFRYLLSYDDNKYIGEPKVLIPESHTWQDIGEGDSIRIPSVDYYMEYSEFVNFVSGFEGIEYMPVQYKQSMGLITDLEIDLPADPEAIEPGSEPVSNPVSPKVNFENIPNVRYYVPGPVNDGVAENENVGNYWASSDVFPVTENISNMNLFFHSDGSLDTIAPSSIEPAVSYVHDPNDPVITVGGGNMTIQTPQGDRLSAGPMNLADPDLAPYTMDRDGVIKFETDFIQDSLSIVGVPKARLFASTSPLTGPSGLTDTDFFVRILDVYPNGEEYFVVGGAVNARARDYAKQLATGIEDIDIPYTNIQSGDMYEFDFRLLPIAYTFGHNHKIKVLISSSNWPRYQSNANVPIETGDFFRRTPNDDLSYTFNSTIYAPRLAEQSIFFSPDQASNITLPVLMGNSVGVESMEAIDNEWFVYPNPAASQVSLLSRFDDDFEITVNNMSGKTVARYKFNVSNQSKYQIDISNLSSGVYIINVITKDGVIKTHKLVKL